MNSYLAKYYLPWSIRNSGQLTASLRFIEENYGVIPTELEESPIFVFSTGWGTGSTLIQRLIMSTGEVLIWGEPYDLSGIVQKMASYMMPISNQWPPSNYFIKQMEAKEYSNQWIANMYPSIEYLIQAQIEFYQELFSKPAKKSGFNRWGIKEVRLTIDHANYFKWLFPNSKFLFIYRNLYDCYLSIKGSNWHSYYPHYSIGNPIYFAFYWKKLVNDFCTRYEEVNGILISYEKLMDNKYDLDAWSKYLNIKPINKQVLNLRLGSRRKEKKLSLYEKMILRLICHEEIDRIKKL